MASGSETCLGQSEPLKKLRKFSVHRSERPMRMVVAKWASARFVGHIVMILLREILSIETIISAEVESSIRIIEALVDGTQHDFSLEVWLKTAAESIEKLDPAVHPLNLGSPGFDGFEGIFVRGSRVTEARQVGEFLDFHLTYSASLNIASKYFDSYSDVAAELVNLQNTSLISCAADPIIEKATLTAAYHQEHTHDSVGVSPSDGLFKFRCSGPGDAVWLSPACRLSSQHCIPVASTSGWGLVNTGLSQKYVFSDMPVAVINYKREDWAKAAVISEMLFYWWIPDPTFSHLQPSRIGFPAHNPAEWSLGMRASSDGSGQIRKFARASFEEEAPADVKFLLRAFTMDINEVMKYLSMWPSNTDVEREFQVACSWVRNSSVAYSPWLLHTCPEGQYAPSGGSTQCLLCPVGYYCPPATEELHMLQHFICPLELWCPLGSAVPKPCEEGWYLIDNQCLQCSEGTYTDTSGSSQCEDCVSRFGLYGVDDGQTRCSFQWTLICCIIGVLAIVLSVICGFRWRFKEVVEDKPDEPLTFTGSWVNSWIGSAMQELLTEQGVAMTSFIPSSPSSTRSSHPRCRSERNSLSSSEHSKSCCPRPVIAYKDVVETKLGIKKARELMRRPTFVVNATPFHVHVENSRVDTKLPAFSFRMLQRIPRTGMHFVVTESTESWNRYWHSCVPAIHNVFVINLEATDWANARSFQGNKGNVRHRVASRYENKVIRFPLPLDSAGDSNGDIKLVWRFYKGVPRKREGEVLLIFWSPPHTLRGIPIKEFIAFLDEVIAPPANPASLTSFMRPRISGSFIDLSLSPARLNASSEKTPSRNMFDADRDVIEVVATCCDSSYAEVRTLCGPADVFISHVWSESAIKTKASMMKLCEFLEDAEGARSSSFLCSPVSSSVSASSSTLSASSQARVWFCTCCNNQSRISEELGTDVRYSPFAKVLRSVYCTRVVLLSPLKALERKWCNFEFSLAVLEGKAPLLLTRTGVVQSGQVPPKELDELAHKVGHFSCRSSRCSSASDEVLIDKCVAQAGGYEALDLRLKQIFHDAVADAYKCAGCALQTMDTIMGAAASEREEDEREEHIEGTTISSI